MQIEDFNFELPEDLIALEPLSNRSESRLAHVDNMGVVSDKYFQDILKLVDDGDVLVFNNTKVLKARIAGEIDGKKAEITLLKRVMISDESGSEVNRWKILAKPGKRFKLGTMFHVKHDFCAKVLEKHDDGIIVIEFPYSDKEFLEKIEQYGSMPLPPYIEKKRKADESDDDRYQTVYAKKMGAVAAPTAGLHFTDEILEKLKEKNVQLAEVTLHVGAGTFLPVRVDDIQTHKMHSEYYEIDEENANIVNQVKENGGRVIAVGTTSLRALESSAVAGKVTSRFEETDIFIYPGYKFQVIDCLVTNFHLPKSTLFMLISAFIGLDNAQKLYNHAVQEEYRFFSYGDSCFLEKNALIGA